ncbi:uncharacterized protein MONOS_17474 [Monocercomonoides exilis]|uniref:uncharacterized protein n=1 Tax=Monocercomonoides exilis TaxID=2049356 RepID=UPI00355A5119|nr:hypothetical protein MONOS_17474 [Monocercomonoides exilis]
MISSKNNDKKSTDSMAAQQSQVRMGRGRGKGAPIHLRGEKGLFERNGSNLRRKEKGLSARCCLCTARHRRRRGSG